MSPTRRRLAFVSRTNGLDLPEEARRLGPDSPLSMGDKPAQSIPILVESEA